jgi:hypothetical protein
MANFTWRVQEWQLGRICKFLPLMGKPETLCIKQLYNKNCISLNSLLLIEEAYKTERISKRKRIFLNNIKCEEQKKLKQKHDPSVFCDIKDS